MGEQSVSCAGRGSERLLVQLETLIKNRDLRVAVEPIYCFGRCAQGPNVRLAPGGEFFERVDVCDLPAIVDRVAAVTGK